MNNRHLYNRIMEKIAVEVKRALNEDKEDYTMHRKQPVHNRIKDHYLDAGYDARGTSKATQNAHKRSDSIEAIYNADLYKNAKKTQADLRLIKPVFPYDEFTSNGDAFIMLQQRSQKNYDTFRIELTPDLMEIAGNEKPTENVTYVAFVDKNLYDTTEMDVYVIPKQVLLDVAHEIRENGHKIPKKNKTIDNFGNWLTLNKAGKNIGLVLKDNWIKDNCIDSFHLDPIPAIDSSYMG